MKNKNSADSNCDAEFIGWQEKPEGGLFPLYIITAADHPYCGSSVSEKSLTELNLRFSKQHNSDEKVNSSDMPVKRPDK